LLSRRRGHFPLRGDCRADTSLLPPFPPSRDPLKSLKRTRYASHTDFGVLWTVATRSHNVLWLSLAYDYSQLTPEEGELVIRSRGGVKKR
jgi:hypothetical protein